MFRLIVPALVCLLAGSVQARELKVLTGAGMSLPVKALASGFGARTGNTVTVVADTAGGVQKRIESGEKFDLVIATEAVMDALGRQGRIAPERWRLAQMVAGIGARKGTPKPAIADAAEVKATLLAASTITYVDPAFGGITGVFFLSQADKIGIGQQVRAKAVLRQNGTGVADAIATGQAQYGVTLISEMLPNPGVTVWPLPDELQMTTIYAASLATDAENAMDAKSLLDDLRGQRGRDESLKAGLKPVAY